MDQDLDNLGRYEKRIMNLEERVTGGELEGVTSEIAILRKELLILREYYDELHDFGKQLEENENNFFSGKNLAYFGTISDRADRLRGRTMYLLDYIGPGAGYLSGKSGRASECQHGVSDDYFHNFFSTDFDYRLVRDEF